jgi:chemotaxis protein MotB
MVTYSDLVTLLLTFFVLLLSMSSLDPVRFNSASKSLKEAFNIHDVPSQTTFVIPVIPSPPISQISPILEKTTEKVHEKIQSQIDALRLNSQVGVLKRDDESIVLRINDSVLFEPGQSKITPRSYPILRNIADIIRPLPMDLRIEGHTDDTLIAGSKFGNWDLSVGRSVSVLRFFTQSDLLALDRMASVGYGSDRPVVPNNDEAANALNRRVDFVLRLKSNTSREIGTKSVPF